MFTNTYSQVGINVDTPKATLEVAASPNDTNAIDGFIPPRLTAQEIKDKDHLYTSEQRGTIVYILEDPTTNFLSTIKTEKITSKGLFHFDGDQWQKLIHNVEEITNPVSPAARNTIYSAKKEGGWSLINSNSFGWSKVGLSGLIDTEIGTPTHLVEGTYTVQEDGIYMVNYEWQLSSGIDLSLLSGRKMGILLNDTLNEERVLNSVRVALGPLSVVTVPVTSTNLYKIMELKQGDNLSFVTTAGVNLALLRNITVSLSVHKISD